MLWTKREDVNFYVLPQSRSLQNIHILFLLAKNILTLIFEFHPNLKAHCLPKTNPISWYPTLNVISCFTSSGSYPGSSPVAGRR